MTGWRFWIDRGGTFTDVVARRPNGELVVRKLLSDDPDRYDDAATQGVREILELDDREALPPDVVDEIRMGTTVATNALLERRGEPTLLVVTRGFGDALAIGYQDRPDIFALDIRLPEPLYQRVLEVDERMGADGAVVRPLDEAAARRGLRAARRAGLKSVAIALLHGYAYAEHEQRLSMLARDEGFVQISASHEVSPLVKLVSRGETTVVDAYLSPILRHYVDRIASRLPGVRTRFMQSHGGLTDARLFRGKDAILSGPAGGIVGAVETCRRAGFCKLITFDMGGTSTDVSHFAGQYERSYESTVAGARLRSPMFRIHTVAAGGGSICAYEEGRYRVGPGSAGADPGPACYGRGGPLTVTDCNVLLGKLQPAFFPDVFGPRSSAPIDVTAARGALATVAAGMCEAGLEAPSPEQLADDFINLACDTMARAIKRVSTQRGFDITSYTLCCLGGAAGQHACLVADALGVSTVILHPLAGVLSAYGMGLADVRALRERTMELPLDAVAEPLQAQPDKTTPALEDLVTAARAELEVQGFSPNEITIERRAHIKYTGTDVALDVPWDEIAAMAAAFLDLHRRRYGFLMADRALTMASLAVEAVGRRAEPEAAVAETSAAPDDLRRLPETVPLYTSGAWHSAPVARRRELPRGARLAGPAIVCEHTSTTMIEPGWEAEVMAGGELVLRRREPVARPSADLSRRSPLLLEVFNNLLMSIAEQMGATLANTACSVNIKERLDFSCAIFDSEGDLVANAPHLPVHLGSMGASVKAVIEDRRNSLSPGDAYLLNSPYAGGTHLPDLTVVTPVFIGTSPLFFVASRAHHADIGGITPGSMPPRSRTITEEGVLIEDFLLVDGGKLRETQVSALLSGAPHPVRDLPQNLADLRAQVAANARGGAELGRMVDEFGSAVVQAYMQHVQDNAEEAVRRAIDRIGDGSFRQEMDDGSVVAVCITVDREAREATVDFTGTSAQRDDNFNAPAAVCTAAVLYVFRTLVDADIPLNAGCLRPLRIVIPRGSMLDPRAPAAVAAGNVETSQAITNALLGALGVCAASQGTMNNLTFGDDRFQYYETICGGAGAGPNWDGCSAVHTHMTNSRLTDPEVLEWRYPVRVEEFRVRHGSGGSGAHRGGDGVVRRLRFLEPLTAALVSSSRRVPPYGLAGGHPGAPGHNAVLRADGAVEEIPGVVALAMAAGDELVVETPGGGGYGAPPPAMAH
ncbi:MAG TPA: hydantoinase B/oxoprolinase family protein [Thermoleophilia bacterium]|nr:hydantoinase B/oxoprolinase family protein [Thermoleophilia bacterium]